MWKVHWEYAVDQYSDKNNFKLYNVYIHYTITVLRSPTPPPPSPPFFVHSGSGSGYTPVNAGNFFTKDVKYHKNYEIMLNIENRYLYMKLIEIPKFTMLFSLL